ncbi:unknown [Spodoptera litura nucleopolyhedrovirus]|uniref:Uncharacterized protein n=1 Tax=Spodoptera litura multicapsid nucleopolyhedrovirus TaxID=46242 RepID=Q91BC2_NPVST|nr:hypothetical protein [Spodoptera litura nucleopolyhedrovirus]WML75172.1 hypothetical protein KBIHDJOI_00130 [Spodoptera littoralis nucleopolyhedrovirus]AAL01790.1 unknown [Spodoptera litura nucleopolyhedrovirus]QHN73957.1 hypothetical protein [Spodoptera litura nucleopolyhedrovirus]UQV25644.1 hypothetical protein [Spodoptera litura nucleopolyhedrovirus]WOC30965.1 hypothetical protein GACBDANE_00028 [Spodoptera litura nucleopolyhedrovirus]
MSATVETYQGVAARLQKLDTVRCLARRELGEPFSKMNVALNTAQPFVIVNSTNSFSRISVRNCPSMREADSIGFNIMLNKLKTAQRCIFCTRICDPMDSKMSCKTCMEIVMKKKIKK